MHQVLEHLGWNNRRKSGRHSYGTEMQSLSASSSSLTLLEGVEGEYRIC